MSLLLFREGRLFERRNGFGIVAHVYKLALLHTRRAHNGWGMHIWHQVAAPAVCEFAGGASLRFGKIIATGTFPVVHDLYPFGRTLRMPDWRQSASPYEKAGAHYQPFSRFAPGAYNQQQGACQAGLHRPQGYSILI